MDTIFAETRTLRAEQISSTVRVQNPIARTFVVPSQANPNKTYSVNLARRTCTCADFTRRGVVCKHQIAAQRVESKVQTVTVKRQPQSYAELFAALGI